jgi:hypothetical protein
MENFSLNNRIIDCVKEAHLFSSRLGDSTSISRDYIVEKLNDINPTDIHIALHELFDKNIINYNADSGLILIL